MLNHFWWTWISLNCHVDMPARSRGDSGPRICCYSMLAGSSCALINRRSDTPWWEVQLRILSSARTDHAECFSGSCSFHKNSQFPAFPEEEMLKVPSCSAGRGGNQGLSGEGAHCLSFPWQVTGRHSAQSHRSPHGGFQAELEPLLKCRRSFSFSFCSDHVVPVTRATRHRSRKKHPKFLPVARQRKCFWIFAVCFPCWFPNHELFSQPTTIASWTLIGVW